MEPDFPLQFSKIQNSSKRRFVVYVFPRETRSSGSNHRMYYFFLQTVNQKCSWESCGA